MTHERVQLTFRQLVKADAAASGNTERSFLFFAAAMLGINKFSVVMLFRVASALRRKGKLGFWLAALITRLNCILNSCEMSPDAKIGPGFQVPHPVGAGFGPITAGRNFTILQNASLGLRDRRLDDGDTGNYPVLGDDVEIGPSAAVLGSIRLGDGAVVGANAVVLQDVPAGAVAVGNPARILERRRNGT